MLGLRAGGPWGRVALRRHGQRTYRHRGQHSEAVLVEGDSRRLVNKGSTYTP